MSAWQSIRSVIFDVNNVLVHNDTSAGFSCYLAQKAQEDQRIDTMWSGDVRAVLFGLLTKYCPLCDYAVCKKYPISEPGRHIKKALKEGSLTYEGFKVSTTYMLTHYVQCEPKVRIVLDHAAEYFCRPALIMETTKPLSIGIRLFFHMVEKLGPSNVFILSNMPAELFSLFKVMFPEVCASISESHIVISGHLGVAKPDVQAFKEMIKRVGGEPSTMLLIDDLSANVIAARSVGMGAVQFSAKPSFELAAWYKEIGFDFQKKPLS